MAIVLAVEVCFVSLRAGRGSVLTLGRTTAVDAVTGASCCATAAGASRLVMGEVGIVTCFATRCCAEGRLAGYCGTPFICHAGTSITEIGSRSRAASANVRTMCCVAAERFFKINVAPHAIASSSVDFTTVSRMIADEEICMLIVLPAAPF